MTRYNGDGTLATDLDEVVRRIRAIMSPDPTDGGVTAAAVETEAERSTRSGAGLAKHFRDLRDMERARAEKAEQERDEALRLAEKAMDSEDDTLRKLAVMEQPRPLMPADITLHSANSASWVRVRVEHPALGVIEEGIPLPTASAPNVVTDEMVERAKRAYVTRRYKDGEIGRVTPELRNAIHDALTAALTPEPPQRPAGAEDIEALLEGMPADLIGGPLTAHEARTLADHLATHGVRVTTEENR